MEYIVVNLKNYGMEKNYFAFKNLGWNIKALPFVYLFSLGGALISYLSFLVTPWIEKRFKN